MDETATPALSRRFAFLILVVFLAVLVRTAWISDDAMISLRTVMNVTHGYGLTQNVAERVQSFTHPLWVLCLTGAYLLVGNVYYATFLLSLVVSLVAIWLAVTRASSREQAVVAALALVCSRAFVDFATSGLENPLSYVLLAAFVGVYASGAAAAVDGGGRTGRRWLGLLATLTSLLYLTRPDEILLVVPLLLVACWRVRRPGTVAAALVMGALPALAWTAFSIVYYGFPFPNTAYAKLTHGIAQGELWRQGVLYLIDLVDRDPQTAVFVVFAVVLAAVDRGRDALGLAVGIMLYVVFVARVGGDFMAGRFMAVPMFAAVLLVSRLTTNTRGFWVAVGVVVAVVGASSAGPPLRSDSRFDERLAKHNGIVDERVFYFKTNSLMHANRESFAQPEWFVRNPGKKDWNVLDTCGLMGAAGLDFGPMSHLLDECALADPLLSRLPATYHEFWRPGHFRRLIPAGYKESLATSSNLMQDPRMREYYEQLRLIVRSKRLFTGPRFEAIVKMNMGAYDHLIDYDTYRYGAPIRTLADTAEVKPDGTPWDAPGVMRMPSAPVVVRVDDRPGRRFLDVSLDSNDTYRITFLKRYEKVAHVDVGPVPQHRRSPGLASFVVDIPQRAQQAGFDTVFVTTLVGDDNAYAVGHLLLDGHGPTDALLRERARGR
jgi:arabinofuranosyltransferase